MAALRSTTPDTAPPRYCDYYGMLSLADFTRRCTEGTLDSYDISEGEI